MALVAMVGMSCALTSAARAQEQVEVFGVGPIVRRKNVMLTGELDKPRGAGPFRP